MRITYDPEADALYIEFRDVQAHDSVDVEEGVTADLDENGHIIGLELLDASERMSAEELSTIHFENLLLTMPEERTAASARSTKAG